MGAKKKRKDGEEEEEEGGRGKRTKKPSNKWAMSGIYRKGKASLTYTTFPAREEEIREAIEAGKEKASPEKPKKKLTGKGVPDESLHPDACYICRELKSKEDKQNKMIGDTNTLKLFANPSLIIGCDGSCGWWFHWSCIGMTT